MESDIDRKYALDTYFGRMDKILEQDYYSKRKIIAIGVCGLDFSRDLIPKELQIEVFLRHFDLSEKYSLPLFLSERDANGKLVEILEQN